MSSEIKNKKNFGIERKRNRPKDSSVSDELPYEGGNNDHKHQRYGTGRKAISSSSSSLFSSNRLNCFIILLVVVFFVFYFLFIQRIPHKDRSLHKEGSPGRSDISLEGTGVFESVGGGLKGGDNSKEEYSKHESKEDDYVVEVGDDEDDDTIKGASINEGVSKSRDYFVKEKIKNGLVKNKKFAVIVYTHNRHKYLRRALTRLLEYIPFNRKSTSKNEYTLIVSQDGTDEKVNEVIEEFKKKYPDNIEHIQHDQATVELPAQPVGNPAYYYISQHYKFGLSYIFSHERNFDYAIILEEDIEISPDIFGYFEVTIPVLEKDPSLYTISAYNDNGMKGYVQDGKELYRSDFFPGLGWLMSRKLWDEIGGGWPLGYWDEWIREGNVRKGRSVIRPEVSRTFTFGRKGVSKGQFYHQFLGANELQRERINWSEENMSYLLNENYKNWLFHAVEHAHRMMSIEEKNNYQNQNRDLKIQYDSMEEFKVIAQAFGVQDNEKVNVPRMAYEGIITFRYKGNRVFIYPEKRDLLYKNILS